MSKLRRAERDCCAATSSWPSPLRWSRLRTSSPPSSSWRPRQSFPSICLDAQLRIDLKTKKKFFSSFFFTVVTQRDRNVTKYQNNYFKSLKNYIDNRQLDYDGLLIFLKVRKNSNNYWLKHFLKRPKPLPQITLNRFFFSPKYVL